MWLRIHFFFIVLILLSCNHQTVEEKQEINNLLPSNIEHKKIISIYYDTYKVDLWTYRNGSYQVKKSSQIQKHVILPLGIQKIKNIIHDRIFIENIKNEVFSKLNTKPFKQQLIADKITFEKNWLTASLDDHQYQLIIVPSKPDEYGQFKSCLDCPIYYQELYLQCKLEWASLLGNFKEISKEE